MSVCDRPVTVSEARDPFDILVNSEWPYILLSERFTLHYIPTRGYVVVRNDGGGRDGKL